MKEIELDRLEKTKDYSYSIHQSRYNVQDWYHITRVRNNSLRIAAAENNENRYHILMLCYLHNLVDRESLLLGSKFYFEFLQSIGLDLEENLRIRNLIRSLILPDSGDKREEVVEIVEDAISLEKIGAIGLANLFLSPACAQRPVYDPRKIWEDRKQDDIISLFYQSILKIPESMNTKSGKELAESRITMTQYFVQQFMLEFNVDI